MHVGTWADVLAQSIVHGFVAAVVVEALIRLWTVRSSRERLALRLLAVAGPLVVSPALVLAWPERASDEFRDRFAIFTARHWEDVQVLGVPVFLVWLLAVAAAGAALLAMDLWPLVAPRRRAAAACTPPPELPRAVARLAASFGVDGTSVRYLDAATPILFCTGVRQPTIVVSRGTLALLDAEELDAALAHELAHVAERDPAKSWGMMAARTLLFFNPAVQVVARAMAREAEARADERSGAVAGRVPLASALLKLYRATHRGAPAPGRALPLAGAVAEPFRRARTLEIESRCRRLLEPGEPPRPLVAARVALAASGLAALLVMVA
jgi:Zn-dependent protease with chaperone function